MKVNPKFAEIHNIFETVGPKIFFLLCSEITIFIHWILTDLLELSRKQKAQLATSSSMQQASAAN